MTSDEEGAKMIVELQAAAGIKETKEQALEGWRSMSQRQKTTTQEAHAVVCGAKERK